MAKKLREIIEKCLRDSGAEGEYQTDRLISDIQRLMLSEEEIFQILWNTTSNKLCPGEEWHRLAHALFTAQEKKMGEER